MAWTAAGLYGAVAVGGYADLLTPQAHGLHALPVFGLTALALLMAILGPLAPARILSVNGLIGMLCATYASATTSADLSDPAFLFTLPVIWQGLFFGRRGALGVLGLTAIGEAVVVSVDSTPGPFQHWIGVMVAVSAITGVVLALCGRNERLLAAATRQARIDPLTGLLNRRAFHEQARDAIAAGPDAGRYAVIVFDLDHFKSINDEYGHMMGDRLLTHVAAVLAGELAGRGLLARFGGEEFVALTPGMGSEEATALAESLRRRVRLGAPDLPSILISAGVATPRPGERLEAVLIRADQALYVAKRAGRDRVHLDTGPAAGASPRPVGGLPGHEPVVDSLAI